MRLWELETALRGIDTAFPSPNIRLEQYPTPPDIVAQCLWNAQEQDDAIAGKIVLDLGCGTGIFLIGSLLLGAAGIVGVDSDAEALQKCRRNLLKFFQSMNGDNDDDDDDFNEHDASTDEACDDHILTSYNVQLIHAQVPLSEASDSREPLSDGPITTSQEAQPIREHADLPLSSTLLHSKSVDVVFMNPPFGTKTQLHADTNFILEAVRLARISVYSMHLKTCREFFLQRWSRKKQLSCELIAELRYNLDACHKKHRKATKQIAVDWIRWVPECREMS